MKINFVIIFAFLMLLTGKVLADNQATVTSTGTNVVSISQAGDGQSANVTQLLSNAITNIEQSILNNTADVTQDEMDLSTVDIVQAGEGNIATALQQNGSFSFAGITQTGDLNEATIEQSGVENLAEIIQEGNENTAFISQFNIVPQSAPNQVLINQLGDGDSASVMQDGFAHGAIITQSSTAASQQIASVTQGGAGNQLTIVQSGP